MECAACGASWPVVNGVPVYHTAEYFGEVSRDEMQELVRRAEDDNWLRAVQTQFKDVNPEMYAYIVDLNRAAWIPLLPIGPQSTVLDVGCGLGALTHALALNYERVVSIEPIETRMQFTRARLEQEGLTNVDLVQTTLHSLPYFEKTFDLIVLNGVLEWMGAWKFDGTPRQVQIETMAALRKLLKPGGVVLIGIENRIGFESFLGRVDHPGTRFTNLMPRGLASLYLKLSKPGFHRTITDPTQGYRTYTYSPRGYVKLLKEAGYDSVDFWWPPQGYNSPRELLRLSEGREIRDHAERERNTEGQLRGRSFRQAVKNLVLVKTGLITSMTPDVVMMAGGNETAEKSEANKSLMDAVKEILGDGYRPISLQSSGFRNKSVITMVSANGNERAIVKVANVRLPGASAVAQGFDLMQRIHDVVDHSDELVRDAIPAPIGFLQVGSEVASIEAGAQRPQLADLTSVPGYFDDRDEVRGHLDRVSQWLIAVQPILRSLGSEPNWTTIPQDWRRPPDAQETDLHNANSESWVQHGDFHSGNVFLKPDNRHLCVIDWDQCSAGYPPLFDWFSLVTSLYYIRTRIGRLPKGETTDELSFRQTFFEPGWFSDHISALTGDMCHRLGLDPSRAIDYFRDYLCVRHHQFMHERDISQKARWGHLYRKFYDYFVNNRDACVFANQVSKGQRATRDLPLEASSVNVIESRLNDSVST
jgi:SAM-dependent methyltransferase